MARRRGKGAARRPDVVVWVVCAVVVVVATVGLAVLIPALMSDDVSPEEAAAMYEQRCSTCHGLQGQGNIGPQLAGGAVVERYPDIEDQMTVITDGRGEMPPFGQILSSAEIRALAEYTRGLPAP